MLLPFYAYAFSPLMDFEIIQMFIILPFLEIGQGQKLSWRLYSSVRLYRRYVRQETPFEILAHIGEMLKIWTSLDGYGLVFRS